MAIVPSGRRREYMSERFEARQPQGKGCLRSRAAGQEHHATTQARNRLRAALCFLSLSICSSGALRSQDETGPAAEQLSHVELQRDMLIKEREDLSAMLKGAAVDGADAAAVLKNIDLQIADLSKQHASLAQARKAYVKSQALLVAAKRINSLKESTQRILQDANRAETGVRQAADVTNREIIARDGRDIHLLSQLLDDDPGDDESRKDEASDAKPGAGKAVDEPVEEEQASEQQARDRAPAGRAPSRLEAGDVIIAVGGCRVEKIGQYFKACNQAAAPEYVEVFARRGWDILRCVIRSRQGGPFRALGMIVTKKSTGLTISRLMPTGPAANSVATTTRFMD